MFWLVSTLSTPILAEETSFDGYLIPDYDNATQIIHDDGSIEGMVPLTVVSDNQSERNITLPDGSQYRYSYMSGGQCWWYEFVINGGFSSYSGGIVLKKLYTTNPMPVTVYCSGHIDTVELTWSTKSCG